MEDEHYESQLGNEALQLAEAHKDKDCDTCKERNNDTDYCSKQTFINGVCSGWKPIEDKIWSLLWCNYCQTPIGRVLIERDTTIHEVVCNDCEQKLIERGDNL